MLAIDSLLSLVITEGYVVGQKNANLCGENANKGYLLTWSKIGKKNSKYLK